MDELIKQLMAKLESGEQVTQEDILSLSKQAAENPYVFKDYSTEMETLMNDPALQEQTAKLVKSGKISSGTAQGLSAIMSFVDMRTANEQIKLADSTLSKLQKPIKPRASARNPLLKQRINQALRGTLDTEAQLAPARRELLDQYIKDINVAKTASTGQASTFGSLGQVASMRRDRGALGLTPMSQQFKLQNEGVLDDLLAREQGYNMQDRAIDTSLYGTDLEQYNFEAQQAGMLGASGRLNKRNAIGGLLQNIPGIAGTIGTSDIKLPSLNRSVDIPIYKIPQSPTGFGPEIDEFANKTNYNLFNWVDPVNSKYYTD